MTYEVEIGALRAAAAAARAAGDQVTTIHPGDVLRAAGGAIPHLGSAAIPEVAGVLERRVTDWVGAARQYAGTLEGNAAQYTHDDRLAAAAFASPPNTVPSLPARPAGARTKGPLVVAQAPTSAPAATSKYLRLGPVPE